MSKIRLYRLLVKLFLGGLGLILLTEVVLLIVVTSTSDASAAQDSAPKPAHEWYVCGDLGFGSVPGVPDARQRLKLCHERGWTVYTYCTQPSIQAPPLGAICDRINADTYTCGAGFQLIQEYRILETPVDTATSTPVISTATPTTTATQAETPTVTSSPTVASTPDILQTPREQPGGSGIVEQAGHLFALQAIILAGATLLVVLLFGRLKKPV